MALSDAHAVVSRLEETVRHTKQQVPQVNIHLEAATNATVPSQEVTRQYSDLAARLCKLAAEIAGAESAHEARLYRPDEPGVGLHQQKTQEIPALDVVVHTTFRVSVSLSRVHLQVEQIKRAFRQAYPTLGKITIHAEPGDERSPHGRREEGN